MEPCIRGEGRGSNLKHPEKPRHITPSDSVWFGYFDSRTHQVVLWPPSDLLPPQQSPNGREGGVSLKNRTQQQQPELLCPCSRVSSLPRPLLLQCFYFKGPNTNRCQTDSLPECKIRMHPDTCGADEKKPATFRQIRSMCACDHVAKL